MTPPIDYNRRIPYPSVVVVGVKKTIEEPKKYALQIYKELGSPANCVHVITKDDMLKTTKPVRSVPNGVLIGMKKKPTKEELERIKEMVGGTKYRVMKGDKVWLSTQNRFKATNIEPNKHSQIHNPQQQVLWDIAHSDDFQRRITRRNPNYVTEYYSSKGSSVDDVDARKGLDSLPAEYSAQIQLGENFVPTALNAIGRHSHISGLLVPIQ